MKGMIRCKHCGDVINYKYFISINHHHYCKDCYIKLYINMKAKMREVTEPLKNGEGEKVIFT